MCFFIFSHTPNIDYDAPSYINFSSVRPPIYPTFIWVFHWAGKYQFQIVVWVQSMLTFGSLLYARHWLIKNLKIADTLIFSIFLFALITICFHSQMWYIESEGLSFPFFIFMFFLSIECFQEFNLKKIVYLSLWVGILILTRLQFYFLYGVFIFLLFWYLWKKVSIKSLVICTGILLISILFTALIDRSYHYFKNSNFAGAPIIGVQLIIQPLFLANSNAASYFENPAEKNIVQSMLNQIKKQKLNTSTSLLASLKPKYYENAYEEYAKNYILLQAIVYHTFSKDSVFAENKSTSNIAKTLFLHNPKINIYFYIWKIIDSMGGIPFFLFFCLLLFSVIIRIFRNRDSDADFSQTFVALAVIITFLNAGLVAVVEPALPSYFCYFQFLLYSLAALFADRIFFKK